MTAPFPNIPPEDDDAPRIERVDHGEHDGAMLTCCPFCGEALSFLVIEGIAVEEDGTELSAVSCNGCGASGPMVEGGAAPAVAAWIERRPAHVH